MTEKEEWFKEQCRLQGLSTEEITVFGVDDEVDWDHCYATNRDGDFLFVLKHEDDRFTMEYVLAINMIEVESIYPEWLLGLVQSMPESYDPDPESHVSRWALDKIAIVHCFRECISRNVEFSESYRKELLLKPAMGVFFPYDVATFNQVVPGMWDSTEIMSGKHIPEYVVQPEMLLRTEGYRFAVKLIDVERFISIYGLIQEEGQYGPFRVLAELEEVVLRTWKEEGKIRSYYWLSNFEKRYRTPSRSYWMPFFFSHFEVEREPNAAYRTIFLVYMNEYREFDEW